MTDENKSGNDLIEEGIGLICGGAFRMLNIEGKGTEALDNLDICVSILLDVKRDFAKHIANKEEPNVRYL